MGGGGGLGGGGGSVSLNDKAVSVSVYRETPLLSVRISH